MICLLCNYTQKADKNKVLSEKNRMAGLKLFQKQPTLCRFMNKTRQQSLLHSTQKETNHLQTAQEKSLLRQHISFICLSNGKQIITMLDPRNRRYAMALDFAHFPLLSLALTLVAIICLRKFVTLGLKMPQKSKYVDPFELKS